MEEHEDEDPLTEACLERTIEFEFQAGDTAILHGLVNSRWGYLNGTPVSSCGSRTVQRMSGSIWSIYLSDELGDKYTFCLSD